MIDLIIFIILFSLGYFFGRYAESRHYASIIEREKKFANLPTTNSKYLIGNDNPSVERVLLVTGAVVVSVDYFKRILAIFRNLFGGNVRSYESLLDRARREAILRLKESCADADQIINLRIETSSIYKGRKQNTIGSVELLAYGTAVYFK